MPPGGCACRRRPTQSSFLAERMHDTHNEMLVQFAGFEHHDVITSAGWDPLGAGPGKAASGVRQPIHHRICCPHHESLSRRRGDETTLWTTRPGMPGAQLGHTTSEEVGRRAEITACICPGQTPISSDRIVATRAPRFTTTTTRPQGPCISKLSNDQKRRVLTRQPLPGFSLLNGPGMGSSRPIPLRSCWRPTSR